MLRWAQHIHTRTVVVPHNTTNIVGSSTTTAEQHSLFLPGMAGFISLCQMKSDSFLPTEAPIVPP